MVGDARAVHNLAEPERNNTRFGRQAIGVGLLDADANTVAAGDDPDDQRGYYQAGEQSHPVQSTQPVPERGYRCQ